MLGPGIRYIHKGLTLSLVIDKDDMQIKNPVAPASLQPKTFGSGYLHLTLDRVGIYIS
jgi:hypothetical protein